MSLNETLQVVQQCAPVLAGVKPANLLSLPEMTSEKVAKICGHGVSCHYLGKGKERSVWFLYREEEVQRILSDRDVQEFLLERGYRSFAMPDILEAVQEEICAYWQQEAEYPHELGVLLGYPLADVKGFVEHQGKNYLYSGYWKVYSDVESAKHAFELYNRVKREMKALILDGAVKMKEVTS